MKLPISFRISRVAIAIAAHCSFNNMINLLVMMTPNQSNIHNRGAMAIASTGTVADWLFRYLYHQIYHIHQNHGC